MFSSSVVILCAMGITILLLAYQSVAMFRQKKKMKEQLLSIEAELSKNKEKENQQSLELIELKKQIAMNLSQDALTGLVNRSVFDDRLSQVLNQSKRHQLLFAILFLNLDEFKMINDALGLDAGDELIKKTAERLRTCIRQLDTVSRFGGDTFVFLLPQLTKSEVAAYVAQRLLNTIAETFFIKGQEIFMTASIGIAVFPHDGDNATVLLKNADYALHRAKAEGRNGFQFYRKEMHRLSQRELVLDASLHQSTLYEELLVYYQPYVNVETKKIVGMEAMLCWKHADLGLIPMKDYLRLAEKKGNIIQMGEWLLRHASEQFSAWKSLGFFIEGFAVHVSVKQLENPHFAYHVSQILQEYAIPPSALMFEMSGISGNTISEKTLLMLKEKDVQIGVVDFGVENMALHQLLHFPMDYLKIADFLVREMTLNKDVMSLVKMIIALAHSLGLRVMASGVETQKQVAVLKKLGCHTMQGNFFIAPFLPNEYTLLTEKSILENV